MGHHSWLGIAGHPFLHCRDSHLPEVAALFTEADRRPVARHTHPDGQKWAEFVYATTVTSLRQRLQVQGFTASRARDDLAKALTAWGQNLECGDTAPDVIKVENSARQLLAADSDAPSYEDWQTSARLGELLDDVSWRMGYRSYIRLLLECAPDLNAEVCLDLTQLTGCCVELDPSQPIAGQARTDQLDSLTQNAPLLVLTEGTTDARLLAAGMEVTHPHLKGFVNFFDFAASGAEGGVAQLSRNVTAFLAAGVANRFVALADNDTEAHAGLEKLKKQTLPERCRVLHYPPLPLLEAYPTLGPYTDEPVVVDINGRAGTLEMYLGQDVLQNGAGLMPVQWRSWNPKLGRYQGTLADGDKKEAQKRFEDKVRAHRTGSAEAKADWTGIRSIIDTIVTAFD
ncbi:hypothetical protein AB0I84_13150 [Streptomyces spectabilis]|uniref:HEPN/Toprim-associated domain-containing protein n=1 Tax=Streptomyces spectabilis TaxID=68270 RepID=UPI00340CB8A2